MDRGFSMDQALAEAARCLLCHEAPCSSGCPAGTQPDRFIRKLRLRNIKGAVRVVKENNILGGVCAAICPTCTLCQTGCSAAGLDLPVRIGQIQRFLVEWAWETGFQPLEAPPAEGPSVAVVGGGPSGLACAAELALAGVPATVFEKEAAPGGMLRYAVPEHRLSTEFLDREIADVAALGVEIRCSSPVGTKEDIDRLFADGFDAVYVATGAGRSLPLESAPPAPDAVVEALSFLRKAKVDPEGFAELVRGREIAIVGGGDTAMDVAVTARRHGAAETFILYRRSFLEMPGSREEKLRALDAGVHFVVLTLPLRYIIEQGVLAGVQVLRTRLGEPDESGRRRPVPVPGSESIIEAELAVAATGQRPAPAVRAFGLDVDGQDRILVSGPSGATSRPGIWAGGDGVSGASIVANAVRDGKAAARAIIAALGRDRS